MIIENGVQNSAIIELVAQNRLSVEAALQIMKAKDQAVEVLQLVKENKINSVVATFLFETDRREAGRLLLQVAKRPKPSEPSHPRPRRRYPNRKKFTNQDHYKIVQTFLKNDKRLNVTVDELGFDKATIQNHLKYAGITPCFCEGDAKRVMTWRRRRGLYLDLGTPKIESRFDA